MKYVCKDSSQYILMHKVGLMLNYFPQTICYSHIGLIFLPNEIVGVNMIQLFALHSERLVYIQSQSNHQPCFFLFTDIPSKPPTPQACCHLYSISSSFYILHLVALSPDFQILRLTNRIT